MPPEQPNQMLLSCLRCMMEVTVFPNEREENSGKREEGTNLSDPSFLHAKPTVPIPAQRFPSLSANKLRTDTAKAPETK